MGQVIVFSKIGRLNTKIVMVQNLIFARFSPCFPNVFPWFSHGFPHVLIGVRALRAEEPGGFQSGQEEMGLVRGLEGLQNAGMDKASRNAGLKSPINGELNETLNYKWWILWLMTLEDTHV
jgi:hypothetical protein